MANIDEGTDFSQQAKESTILFTDTPGTDSRWVSMRYYKRARLKIDIKNGAALAEPTTITLQQAKKTDGSDAKALNFTTHYCVLDSMATDWYEDAPVTSNQIVTTGTENKIETYIIELKYTDLDYDNDFTALKLLTSGGQNIDVHASITLWPPKHTGALPTTMCD